MNQSTASFPLLGGMDLITAPQRTPPGRVIAALNYEPVMGGYKRLRGFERFDGRAAPSDATYWRVNYTDGGFGSGTAPPVGAILYNGSPDHFVVCAIIITSGTFAGGNAAGYFIATNYIGTITPTQGLFSAPSAGFLYATAGTITLEYDFGAAQNAIYRALAISTTRSLIQAVPGSGPVRGVWCFENEVLAFRDNAGATAGVMFRATTAGWVEVANLTRIDFTSDTATQTLPGLKPNTSPAINIANVSSGTSDGIVVYGAYTGTVGTVWTGFMMVSGYNAGSWTAGGQTIYKTGTATQYGTTTAAPSVPTITAGGRYFFLNNNFYGASDHAAMYAVNGVGKAITYDGSGFANISTGMTLDTPNRIASHRKSLFLSFPGGSVQFSEVGEPLVFDPILGAGEIGIGSDVTDLIPANKTTLAILGQESINVLYGNDATDYQLEVLTDEAGALPFTAQKVGQVIYMDNGGIRKLTSSAAYGNFNIGSVSQLIAPLLADYVRDGVRPVATFTSRRRNQYWLFFDNGAGLVGHFGRKEPEFLPFVIGKTVSASCSVEVNSIERMFIGCSDGFVYEMDKGTSFDGTAIEHYVRLPFNSFGSPQVDKRVFKGTLSLEASGTTTLSVAVDMDFGAVAGFPAQNVVVTTGGGALDDLGSNEDYFASQIETVGEVYFDGVARNFSMTIRGETADEEPHTLVDVTYHLAQRRLVR